MAELRIEYLNHASLLISSGEVRLLSDPWFEGTAFSGGFGLRYANPTALERAATATHLWLSHWHSDHLHAPTLQKLAKANPDMIVLANVSANFTMVQRLEDLGFHNVQAFYERRRVQLSDDVEIQRIPTAGIDNMLHIRAGQWTVVNYNDCNLPARAIHSLRKTLGPIDVLCTNFNHAGKLYDQHDDETRRAELKHAWGACLDAFAPRYAIPFASLHYYRAATGKDQNDSLLSFDDMEALAEQDSRMVVLRLGDAASFNGSGDYETDRIRPPLREQAREVHDYGPSVPWEELLAGSTTRCQNLHKNFLGLGRMTAPLIVRITDHDRNLRLKIGEPARGAYDHERPHIEAHSVAIYTWLARAFGDDTFVAGAHFRLLTPDTRVIELWTLITLLEASHLDPRRIIQSLASAEGRRFWWNRREECVATLLGRRFKAGQARM